MRRSLRLLVAAVTSAVALSLLIPLGLLVGTLAQERALQVAGQEAAAVAAVVSASTENRDGLVAALDQQSPMRISVVLPDGTVLGSSDAVDATPGLQDQLDDELARARGGESFSAESGGSPVVYVPVITGTSDAMVVRVAVPAEAADSGVGPALGFLIALGVVMLVAAVVIADVVARRISAPLLAIADTARRHRSGDLEARAPETGPPEVVEVGRALNALAERIEELLRNERENLADLAHRLRTPVTALRLAVSQVDDPSVERVRRYVDDVERSVDTLVRDARRPLRGTMSARCNPAEVAASRVDFWTPLAEDRGVELAYRGLTSARLVPVHADELAEVLDVLLDNAFAHAADLSRVDLEVSQDGAFTTLSVSDDGAGFSREAVARGVSMSGSTGLGLDIARRTAEASGGDLSIGTSPAGGASVRLRLPTLQA